MEKAKLFNRGNLNMGKKNALDMDRRDAILSEKRN